MAIESHELLPLFVGCCPGLRALLVQASDDWLQEDGTIAHYLAASLLTDYVVERFDAGDYGFSDELFALVERLLANGSEEVKNVVATGFLESLVNQQRLPSELWVPLIGPEARDYLRAWDRFTGAVTRGLEEPA
jgi:hypothetical protein